MYGQPNSYQAYPYSGYGNPSYMQRPYLQNQPIMPQQQAQMAQSQEQQVQPQAQVQQQPQIPMQAQQVPFPYNAPSIQAVRYATEDEAKAFILYPNYTAIFIDEAKGKVYVKSANQGGFSSIRTYSESIDGAEQQTVKPQELTPKVDYEQFASKEQLKGLENQYSLLLEQFKALQNQINSAKSTAVVTQNKQ